MHTFLYDDSFLHPFAIVVPCVIFWLVHLVIKGIKQKDRGALKMGLLSVVLFAAAMLSWFLNLGWLRVTFTVMLVPVWHFAIFFNVNYFAASYFSSSKKMKRLNVIYCITYLVSYIALPDAADDMMPYVLFGLIKGNAAAGIFGVIFALSLLTHIVVTVMQIFEMLVTQKTARRESAGEIE